MKRQIPVAQAYVSVLERERLANAELTRLLRITFEPHICPQCGRKVRLTIGSRKFTGYCKHCGELWGGSLKLLATQETGKSRKGGRP